MKKFFNIKKSLIKGTSAGMLVSAGIHLVLLLIAGGLVVFTIIDKKDAGFVPTARLERPKMKLKKVRVKMKKSVTPRTTQRISVKAGPMMPDVVLPDVSGMGGGGLSGGIGGYEMMPDPSEMTLFGGSKSAAVGNDFEGTFYLLNRTRSGEDKGYDPPVQFDKVTEFIESGWNPYVFSPYYRSSKKLYATQFIVPLTPFMYGPQAFGMNFNSEGSYPQWVIHYKGKIRSEKGGRYRFWGTADEILFVRIRGKLVLNGCYGSLQRETYDWDPPDKNHLQYVLAVNGHASIGHWFTLEPGEVVEMEVLIGDFWSPHFGVILLIEDEEESGFYVRRKLDDMPLLPVFRTAEMSEAVKDLIKYNTFREDYDLDGGEVLNVY